MLAVCVPIRGIQREQWSRQSGILEICRKSAKRNPDTTYITLHHLYITERAMLRKGVQAGKKTHTRHKRDPQATAILRNPSHLPYKEEVVVRTQHRPLRKSAVLQVKHRKGKGGSE